MQFLNIRKNFKIQPNKYCTTKKKKIVIGFKKKLYERRIIKKNL